MEGEAAVVLGSSSVGQREHQAGVLGSRSVGQQKHWGEEVRGSESQGQRKGSVSTRKA